MLFDALALQLGYNATLVAIGSALLGISAGVTGTFLFLLPLCGFLGYKAWDFVAVSWQLAESSREPGGMPYPFVPLLKSVLVIMPLLLALQGVSILVRALRVLRD